MHLLFSFSALFFSKKGDTAVQLDKEREFFFFLFGLPLLFPNEQDNLCRYEGKEEDERSRRFRELTLAPLKRRSLRAASLRPKAKESLGR